MIVAHRCSYFTRILLQNVPKTCLFQNEIPLTYSRTNLNWPSCGYCKYDFLIPKLKMNNPARTSTVVLENYYVQVANFLKNPSYKVEKSFSKTSNGLWACDIVIKWPMSNTFRAEQSKKTEAARVASWLAIQWLQSLNKIDNEGRPLLVANPTSIPEVRFEVKPELIQAINALSMEYNERVKPFYDQYEYEHRDEVCRYFHDYQFPLYDNIPNAARDIRDDSLNSELGKMPPQSSLPIDGFSAQIVDLIEKNRVVVIKGATGSGKTTRIPQFLLNHYIRNGFGSNCNIIVTQPRRISAISLANRIASERSENLGFSVGHHVRFSQLYPSQPGTIMFVSSGMLLQRLVIDPMLQGISHLIIDEAHERDLNIDLLLMLTRELLKKNNKLRIVIMSATINAEFFQQYYNNCPLLSIPGDMYNVQTHYIDDPVMSEYFARQNYEYDERDIDDNLIIHVVQWIHQSRPSGAILVFLPGWSDISKILNVLQNNDEMFVLIAHSKMKDEQQELIFRPPPKGKRKVILATNIAECSITIPDVVYVVDSGLSKEVGNINGIKGLANTWISKAVADQRRGRAGRITEGECFRLYSRKKYESFDQYPVPEILRVSLESLIMRIKMYSDDKLVNTLHKFPNIPPLHTIMDAIKYLQQIDVFDPEENLTPLGRRIAMFGLHPLLSVALVYSVFFKCTESMLLITSALNGDSSIFPVGSKSSDRRNLLSKYHPTNDMVAMYRIYDEWRKNSTLEGFSHLNMTSLQIFRSNHEQERDILMKNDQKTYVSAAVYCLENVRLVIEQSPHQCINTEVLHLNLEYLFKARLVTADDMVRYSYGESEGDGETLATSVLFAATGRLAVNDKPYHITGKTNHYLTTLDGLRKVQISNDSVNFKQSQSSPFLTYYHINRTEENFLRIFETAQISSLSVLLFSPMSPEILSSSTSDEIRVGYPSINLHILAKKNDLIPILRLREMIQHSLKFFVAHYDSTMNETELISHFKEHVISVLQSLMQENN